MASYSPVQRHSRPVGARKLAVALLATFFLTPALSYSDESKDAGEVLPEVRVLTSEGAFEIRLRPDIAPQTVANFLRYVDEGYYEGTIFHRVIPGFMVQAGGFDQNMSRKNDHEAVANESRQTARNLRGTIAMARTADPDSATSQFFVNLVDNPHLDATPSRAGYTVFGSVTDGMGVIDAIGSVDTTNRNNMGDVPVEPVVIESVRRIESDQ